MTACAYRGAMARHLLVRLAREASSTWAANAVSRLHLQLAEVGTEHVTQVEGPGQHQVGEQLMLTSLQRPPLWVDYSC
jgi:hypothetical protein